MIDRSMFTWFSAALLCAGLFVVAGCSGVLEPRDVIADATEMLSEGKNQAAIDILRPFIYKHNDSFQAHMLAGKAFLLLNPDEEKNLYLARHYFSSASKLAPNEGLRSQANQAHFDVKMRMGKISQAADTLVESAERMSALGESGQAANQFLQAAGSFIKAQDYDDAIESCQKGIFNNPDARTFVALHVILARAFYLDKNYLDCREAVESIGGPETERTALQSAEIEFLQAAAPVLAMQGGRKLLNPLKKEFEKDRQQLYIDEFYRSLNLLGKMMPHADADEKAVIGRYGLALARHARKHSLDALASQAYQKSRNAFRAAGMEKVAIEVGEELEDLVG